MQLKLDNIHLTEEQKKALADAKAQAALIRLMAELKQVASKQSDTLSKIESKEPIPFPEIPKADFSTTNKLLGELLIELKKPEDITVVLKIK